MHLLPIELYLILVAVLPLGLCFAKWRYSLGWGRGSFASLGSLRLAVAHEREIDFPALALCD